jgi:glycerophosphoryl diester phosphodiesterase
MKYIAHRGLSSQAPENTIASFLLAANQSNFFGIECDIHETKDHQFVVFHDDDLKRMAKVDVKIADSTYEELKQYVIKTGSKIKSNPHQTIPLLHDFLTICEEYQKAAIIEVKHVQEMENLIKLLDIFENFPTVKVILISFNLSYLKYLRAISDISLQLLCDKVNDALIYDLRVNQIDISIQKDSFKPTLISKLKKKGFEVATFTVNKKSTAKQLEKIGIDYITTDKIL